MTNLNLVKLSVFLFILMLSPACDYSIPGQIQIHKSVAEQKISLGIFLTKVPPSEGLSGESVIRSRIVTIDTETLLNSLLSAKVNALSLNFFDDALFNVAMKKQTLNNSGSITWQGVLPSISGSISILVISKEGVEGFLDIPNQGLFSVRRQADGNHLIEEINRSAIR